MEKYVLFSLKINSICDHVFRLLSRRSFYFFFRFVHT